MPSMLRATALALTLLAPGKAPAAPVTAIPDGVVLRLPAVDAVTAGPSELQGGAVWSSSYRFSLFGYAGAFGPYGLAGNGAWDGRPPMVGLNAKTGTMTIAFATPVSAVGAFLNYAPGFGVPEIAIRDQAGALIEAFSPVIATPGGENEGAFHGFALAAPEIASFTLSNAFIVARDVTVAGLPTGIAVPAPPALALFGCGLLGLARTRRYMPSARR